MTYLSKNQRIPNEHVYNIFITIIIGVLIIWLIYIFTPNNYYKFYLTDKK